MPKPIQLLIKFLYGPIFWGAAFLAPLMAALMVKGGIPAPIGLTEIQFTLILGTLWGIYARMRGAWI